MYFVYRYFNKENELIYIGLTEVSPKVRLLDRKNGEVDWYDEIERVEYVEFNNSKEMTFCEFYLISKIKPKYNTKDTEFDLSYDIPYFDNLTWKSWSREEYLKMQQEKKSNRRSKINYELWSNEEYKKKRIEKMRKIPYKLYLPNGQVFDFNSRKELESHFKKEYNMSPRVVADLIKKEVYNTHYSKWKHLEGMRLERIG